MNKRTKEISMISIFIALIVVMSTIPFLGYPKIGPVSMTTIHIVVLIGGAFGGRKVAYSLALVFGLSSMLNALYNPLLLDEFFQNPLISVLPRVLWGATIYEIFNFTKKFITNKYLATGVYMALATFVHSAIVAIAFILFAPDLVSGALGYSPSYFNLLFVVFGINVVAEIFIAILIGTPIATRLLDLTDQPE